MTTRRLRRVLTSPHVVAELTHLFRQSPRLVGEQLDAGTMCRDSAFVVACIAARLGRASTICTGQSAFFAPLRDGGPGCLHFKTHAWTRIDGFGLCDLTDASLAPDYISGDAAAFGRAMAAHHAQPPDFAAVYLEEQRHMFDTMMFGGAVNFAQSPLIKDLSTQPYFSLDILGKAALHVWRMIKGDTPSLRRCDQNASWAAIAAIDSGAVETFRLRLRLPDASL
jgi:hypothetical protein